MLILGKFVRHSLIIHIILHVRRMINIPTLLNSFRIQIVQTNLLQNSSRVFVYREASPEWQGTTAYWYMYAASPRFSRGQITEEVVRKKSFKILSLSIEKRFNLTFDIQ